MISSFEYAITWFENHTPEDSFFRKPLFLQLRPLVPASALFAAIVRGIIESPIEYAKVMGQTGQKWVLKDIYRGYQFQILRTSALLVPIFCTLDIFRRNTDVLGSFTGNFLVQAGASGVAYLCCWPLETLKNLSQSGTPFPGATVKDQVAFLGGPRGLFRGVGPGTLCGSLRNGCAMVVMVYAQSLATQLGLRE
jgi:hypothetical protein